MPPITSFQDQYDAVASLLRSFITETGNFLNAISNMASHLRVPEMYLDPQLPPLTLEPITLSEVPRTPTISVPGMWPEGIPPESDYAASMLGNIHEPAVDNPPTAPSVFFPNVPVIREPSLPTEPYLHTVYFPDPPDVTIPDVPTLLPVTIPDPPTISDIPVPDISLPPLSDYGLDKLPNFDEFINNIRSVAEDLGGVRPDITKEELNEIKSFLRDRGLASDQPVLRREVFNELVNQYREQYNKLINEEYNRIVSIWSSRGFTMPFGLIQQTMRRAQDDLVVKRWDFERELLNKQIDITREDTKFYTTEHTKFMEFYSDFILKSASAVIEANKAMADLYIKFYDVAIALYKIAAENIKLKVEIYSKMLEAERNKIDIYARAVEASAIIGNLNRSLVEVYVAQLSAFETRYKLYATEVQAKTAILEADKIALDLYKSKLESISILSKIDELKLNTYAAQLKGEELKVRTYEATVDAWAKKAEVAIRWVDEQLKKVDEAIRLYEADIRGFVAVEEGKRARVLANVEIEKLKTSVFQTEVDRFKAGLEGQIASKQNERELMKLELERMVESLKIAERNLEANIHALVSTAATRADLAKAGATVSSTVLASALNSLNGIVHLVETIISSSSE